MNEAARAAIRAGYLEGDTIEQIAHRAAVSIDEAEIYLGCWCDEGCPGA